MKRVDWFRRIRIHEAGHAVAAYLIGRHIQSIKIKRQHTIGQQGAIYCSRKGIKYTHAQGFYIPRIIKKVIFEKFAGGIAEMWFFKTSRYDASDWRETGIFLNRYIGNKGVANRRFETLLLETVDWFAKPLYMKAVAAVANALKDKPNMRGREIEKIIRSTGLKPLKKWVSK